METALDKHELLDLREVEHEEVFVDSQYKLWLNIDGKCVVRIGKVKHLTVDDPIRGQDNLW